ncbi:hypothetical protein EYF80_002593 [Liparis tanakae]|uniref:Uncharacterized protein n=1 Tax=Liparis tanakae TaxID=230148 RepID=A0A4Z2JDP2_9TELE|nr:hypothetical protein EYF80_002593 [Liparis tanakae]
MVRRGCRLARPPGGSVEQPVVNWRNAFRSSDDIPHRTRTKRVKPGLRAAWVRELNFSIGKTRLNPSEETRREETQEETRGQEEETRRERPEDQDSVYRTHYELQQDPDVDPSGPQCGPIRVLMWPHRDPDGSTSGSTAEKPWTFEDGQNWKFNLRTTRHPLVDQIKLDH